MFYILLTNVLVTKQKFVQFHHLYDNDQKRNKEKRETVCVVERTHPGFSKVKSPIEHSDALTIAKSFLLFTLPLDKNEHLKNKKAKCFLCLLWIVNISESSCASR